MKAYLPFVAVVMAIGISTAIAFFDKPTGIALAVCTMVGVVFGNINKKSG